MEPKRLFISDLPESATEEDVRNRFKKYGAVTGVDIKERKELGPRNTSHYFAYVSLNVDNISLDKCLNDANNNAWHGEYVRITVARENFLDRLKREREQTKDTDKDAYKAPPQVEQQDVNHFRKINDNQVNNFNEDRETKLRNFNKFEDDFSYDNNVNNVKKKRKFVEDDYEKDTHEEEFKEPEEKTLKYDHKGFDFNVDKITPELFTNGESSGPKGFTFGFKSNHDQTSNFENEVHNDASNINFNSFKTKENDSTYTEDCVNGDYYNGDDYYQENGEQGNDAKNSKELMHRQRKWQQQFFFTYSDSRFEDGKQLLEKISNLNKNRFLEDRKMMKHMVKIQKRSQLNYQNFLQEKSMERMAKASNRIIE
ncbi:PREDICTED: GRIP and coiled-coil domain-containing protein PFC0235w-like [Nicrophorus vespilloides]|uniref:GRIP and coiled-coil domain-containing protein PFC0235w-like n=1 Tax=Nicrophorus vespilloides TaxID=110193 RepID=A0ABM1N3D4_NICVS|nr:PREDICTED: GRIP and coiled-coil domain-containing protein PFC0235w-like [Nicrophorus vespilloides]